MQKIFLYQVYTALEYVPPMYRRVKKLPVLMINKDVRKSLVHKNGNNILIWIWNNPHVMHCGELSNKGQILLGEI